MVLIVIGKPVLGGGGMETGRETFNSNGKVSVSTTSRRGREMSLVV